MSANRGITDATPIGNVLDAVALNAAVASRRFITDTGGWNHLLLQLDYTHANNGTLTILLEGVGEAVGTNVYTMTTGQTTDGATVLNYVTGATTPTLSGNKKLEVLLDVKGRRWVRVTVTHNGTPNASDILTCSGALVA